MSQFFLQCDAEGRIIWMSDRARLRLRLSGNLLHSLPVEHGVALRRLLGAPVPPREAVQSWIVRPDSGARLPVRLSRLLATQTGVLLAAEVGERRSDSEPAEPAQEMLWRMHRRLVSQYFRLLAAREYLERRRPHHPHRVAEWTTEQIERDRTRVARELHSGAGQALAGILLQVETLNASLEQAPESVRDTLHRLESLARSALDQVRHVAHRLYTPDWQHLPLARALETLWTHMGISRKFEASLEITHLGAEPSLAVRLLVYRAAQETLSNVIRHANATRVQLALERRGSAVWFSIADNGRGFDPAVSPAAGGGIGLRSLREQVQEIGGEFRLSSAPQNTKIVIILPLTNPDE